jgi:adenosylmethionine-8-amino-7-oxononanoate aminotransferase
MRDFAAEETARFSTGTRTAATPLGCAVAREVLAVYRDERVLENVARIAPRIERAFSALHERVPSLRRPRALGAIGAIDLGDSGYLADAGWRVYAEARARGAYVRPLGDTVYVAPPLTIDLATLDELLEIVGESVAAALG